ncbi:MULTISPECIES: hypothetical protein [unclassified Amycolatopsis]|uniref:hypothetical protein n=1 Tax=unclassified Amycolatopsis TaxID=2618356 RepID=UPI0034557587
MAWVYALNAECGPHEDRAQALARHFADWPTRVFPDGDDWWCGVLPEGLSRSGAKSAAEAEAMTAAGHALYDRLRTAPPVCRFALAGVETDLFRTFAELRGEDLRRFPGLVVDDDLWRQEGAPAEFGEFSPGYRWLPYPGEVRP